MEIHKDNIDAISKFKETNRLKKYGLKQIKFQLNNVCVCEHNQHIRHLALKVADNSKTFETTNGH